MSEKADTQVDELARELAEKYSRVPTAQLDRARGQLNSHPIYLSLLGTVVVSALLLVFVPPESEGKETIQVISGLVSAAVAIAAIFVWRGMRDASKTLTKASSLSPPDIYFRNEQLKRKLNENTRAATIGQHWLFACSTAQSAAIQLLRDGESLRTLEEASTVADFANITGVIEQKFVSFVNDTLGFLETHRELLLAHSSNAIYFIEVFELTEEKLKSIAHRRSDGTMKHGRVWRVGEGQIGAAISAGVGQISHDLNAAPRLHQLRQSTDAKYFVSAISQPIPAFDGRSYDTYGVICVTSSTANQFTEAHVLYLELLAFSLSSLFCARVQAHKRISDVQSRRSR